MTYSKQTWSDGQAGATPITAARLNNMEDGIQKAYPSSGRVAFDITTKIATDQPCLSLTTLPAQTGPCRVTLIATGKGGFDASARAFRWRFDSTPTSATNLSQDEDVVTTANVAAAQWVCMSASLSMDLPAGVAPTFRVVMTGDGSVYNRGSVIWHITPL